MLQSVVLLPAGLSVKGEGYLLAAGLPDDDLLLVHGVGGIGELSNIEAFVFNLVLALDLRTSEMVMSLVTQISLGTG